MRRKFFLEGVWLGGGEGKEMVGPGVFSRAHQKVFFSKWGENQSGKKTDENAHVYCAHGFRPRPMLFFPPNHLHVYNYLFIYLKMCYFFVLFNGVIIIYLYQLHFSNLSFFLSTKQKFFISPLFHLHNQTKMGENQGHVWMHIFHHTISITRHSSLITHQSLL